MVLKTCFFCGIDNLDLDFDNPSLHLQFTKIFGHTTVTDGEADGLSEALSQGFKLLCHILSIELDPLDTSGLLESLWSCDPCAQGLISLRHSIGNYNRAKTQIQQILENFQVQLGSSATDVSLSQKSLEYSDAGVGARALRQAYEWGIGSVSDSGINWNLLSHDVLELRELYLEIPWGAQADGGSGVDFEVPLLDPLVKSEQNDSDGGGDDGHDAGEEDFYDQSDQVPAPGPGPAPTSNSPKLRKPRRRRNHGAGEDSLDEQSDPVPAPGSAPASNPPSPKLRKPHRRKKHDACEDSFEQSDPVPAPAPTPTSNPPSPKPRKVRTSFKRKRLVYSKSKRKGKAIANRSKPSNPPTHSQPQQVQDPDPKQPKIKKPYHVSPQLREIGQAAPLDLRRSSRSTRSTVSFVPPQRPRGKLPTTCPHCDKKLSRHDSLAYHLESFHGTMERKYACPICKKKFKRKGHLYEHSKYHQRADSEVQRIHKERSERRKAKKARELAERAQNGDLVERRKERPYKCEFCDKTLSSVSSRNRHHRTFHNLQGCAREPVYVYQGPPRQRQRVSYTCSFPPCGKVFWSPSCRGRHEELIHKRQSSYTCPVEGCGSIFPTPYKLWAHRKDAHWTGPVFYCPDCPGLKLTSEVRLKRHKSIVHDKDRNEEDGNGILKDQDENGNDNPQRQPEPEPATQFQPPLLQQSESNNIPGQPQVYSCSFCPKKWGRKIDLKMHEDYVHKRK